jgi:hypothetical protein
MRKFSHQFVRMHAKLGRWAATSATNWKKQRADLVARLGMRLAPLKNGNNSASSTRRLNTAIGVCWEMEEENGKDASEHF